MGVKAKKAVGRPQGSVASANTVLRGEMKATALMMGRVRALVDEQLSEIRKYLQSTSSVTLSERLQVLETLTTLGEKMNKMIESASKHLVTKDTDDRTADGKQETAEALIAKFTQGGN